MIRLDQFDNRGFDRGASRVKEGLWWLVRAMFFQSRLPWPSGFKTAILRCFGASVGTGVVIRPRVTITFPWRLVVGDHVWIGEDVWLMNLAPIELGSHVCISQRAFLCTGSHDFRQRTFDLRIAPIIVKDHVWVGACCFIGPRVTISKGARVKACVRLTDDLAAGSVADLDGIHEPEAGRSAAE